MCSDIYRYLAFAAAVLAVSCSSYRQLSEIRRNMTDVDVTIPSCEPSEDELEIVVAQESEKGNGPALMNAEKDMETGEMVAVDVIDASTVVARFRNVAERSGNVSLGFDISVPASMVGSRWQLRLFPEVCMSGDTLLLDPVFITGEKYRAMQIRGYERYREFMASIVSDSSDFVRMKPLEIFIERYYPVIYRMKNDTSIVSSPDSENIFGVTQKEVREHYTRYRLVHRNNRKKEKSEKMLGRLTGGLTGRIRLDTVLLAGNDVCYRYTQTVEAMPGLKKIPVALSGGVYEDGRLIYRIPGKKSIDFYVSSLSALADTTLHYMKMTDTVCISDVDTAYMSGVDALRNLDYQKAVEILGEYRDYNSALAYLSAGYDAKALEILQSLEPVSAKVLYLEALTLSRLGMEEAALDIFGKCLLKDRSMLHRGRLDPEIQKFTKFYD